MTQRDRLDTVLIYSAVLFLMANGERAFDDAMDDLDRIGRKFGENRMLERDRRALREAKRILESDVDRPPYVRIETGQLPENFTDNRDECRRLRG